MPTDVCAKCSKPKSAQAGSITQWINVCACDVKPSSSEDWVKSNCVNCGKPIRSRGDGSLTQWIFQKDSCTCERPNAVLESSSSTYKQPGFRGFDDAEEVELEVEVTKFPSERYKPIEILGQGANGTIYLSRDRLLGKLLAVKVLKTLDRETLLSFQNEARTTSKLNHPNIIKVLDFGSTDSGVPFMVMEFVPGSSLEEFIREYGGLDVETTIRLFISLADALDYAHNAGVLHRDLKPGNILLVDDDGSLDAHLIDFGVAKLQEQSTTIYNGTALVGTPAYMSPDQALGREFDNRSDIYSLGCILFETLSGKQAFIADSPLETIALHAQMPPPSILEFLPESTETAAIDRIIQCCLAKDPKSRYQTAGALKQALQELQVVPTEPKSVEHESSESAVYEARDSTENRSHTKSIKLLVTFMVIGSTLIVGSVYFLLFSTELAQMKHDGKSLFSKIPVIENPENYATTYINTQGYTVVSDLSDTSLTRIVENGISSDKLGIEDSALSPKGIGKLRTLKLKDLRIKNQPLTLAHFRELSKLSTLTKIELCPSASAEINYDGLLLLKELPLKTLVLENTSISKKILENIAEIQSLEFVALPQADGFSKTTLAPLAKLPNLRVMDLAYSDITDSSVAPLTSFRQLSVIDVNYTALTDRFFLILPKVENLRTVNIIGCDFITAKAVKDYTQKHRITLNSPFTLTQVAVPDVNDFYEKQRNYR